MCAVLKYGGNTTNQNNFFVDSHYVSLNCFNANVCSTREWFHKLTDLRGGTSVTHFL